MKKHDKPSKTIKSVSSKKGTVELTEEEASQVTGGGEYLQFNLQNTIINGSTDTPTK